MTDITDRIKEAMVSYEKLKGPFDLRFAKEALADDARTLLPEAIEEIKRLEAKLAVAVEALGRIASNEFAGRMLTSMPPQGAAEHFARTTLAELTGGKDE